MRVRQRAGARQLGSRLTGRRARWIGPAATLALALAPGAALACCEEDSANLAGARGLAVARPPAPAGAAAKLLARRFALLTGSSRLTFGDALAIATQVQQLTGVRPAFLLAVTQEELLLERTDLCYLTDLETGAGVRMVDGQPRPKTMEPLRELPVFLALMKELALDPLATVVTCPKGDGWGGAMGPADFIPSAWVLYRERVRKLTGKRAHPWRASDALLAAGLLLADSGAARGTVEGEFDAAMVYYSGSASSKFTFYARGVLELAARLQVDIDVIAAGEP